MSLPKVERNKKLVKLRLKNPDKWTLRKLAEEFNLHYTTVKEILDREINPQQ